MLSRERNGLALSVDVYFQGQRVTKSTNTDLEAMLRTNRYLSYSEFKKIADCHWYYTEEKIKSIDDKLTNLSLPSIMPYFSIAYYIHFSKALQSAMFLNRLCNDLFVKYIQDNTAYVNNDRILYIEEFQQNLSILELYSCLVYAYNRYNDYVKFTELNNFLFSEYGIDSAVFGSNPFTGVYPFRYEKLINWTKFQTTSHGLNLFTSLVFGDPLHLHPSFKFYPKDVETYCDLEYIGQGETLNLDYDNTTSAYIEPNNWTANHSYILGDLVKPTTANHFTVWFKCSHAGTSGLTEPIWQHTHIDDVTTDNTASWKYIQNGTIHDVDYYPYIIPTPGSYYLDQCHYNANIPTYEFAFWERNQSLLTITVFFEKHGYVRGQEIIIMDSSDPYTIPPVTFSITKIIDYTSFTVTCQNVGATSGICTLQNIFDQYNISTYDTIIKQEWDVLFKRYKILTDIYTIKKSRSNLPLDGVNYKIGDYALTLRDETDFTDDHRLNWVDRTTYNTRIYKCIATLGSIEEQWDLQIVDDNFKIFEEWNRSYQKLMHNKYMKNWTWKFAKNYSRNRKDPERILGGSTMPISVKDYYDLLITGNTIGTARLVRKDSTNGSLPSVYNCIATTGTREEQWQFDEYGLWKLNYAINNTLVPMMIDYINNDETLFFNLADTLLSYINVFIHTFIQDDAPNFREMLLGSATKIKLLIDDIKPKRARLLSYETIYGIDDKLQDSVNGQDILNGRFYQKAEWNRRENIRDSDQRNYDTVNPYHYTLTDAPNTHDVGDVYDGDFTITVLTNFQFVTQNNGTPHFIASVSKSGVNVSWDMGDGTTPIPNTNNIDYSGYSTSDDKIVKFSSIDSYLNVSNLTATNDQITEARHLDVFTNLKHLDLNSNQLSGSYSEILKLPGLTYLDLHSNNITYIGIISRFTNLTHLNLADNDIVQFGIVTNMVDLITLNLINLQLSDLASVTNLIYLQTYLHFH